MRHLRPTAMVLGALAVLCGTAHAKDRAIELTLPDGALYANPTGISGKNVFTGYYYDSGYAIHGFIGKQGAITTFDAPGASTKSFQGTEPMAINGPGTVTGTYIDSSNNTHGFVVTSDGTFTSFDDVVATYPKAINDAGTVTGTAHYGTGFLRGKGGRITEFTVAGAGQTVPNAINTAGAVAGFYYADDGSHGFIRTPDGTITTFDPPQDHPNIDVVGIDDADDVVGYVYNGENYAGFIRTAGGTMTMIAPGSCTTTLVTSVNAGGTAVGYCTGDGQPVQGFTRTPDGTTTLFAGPNACTQSDCGTYPTAIGPNGKSVGYTNDQNFVYYGYRLNAPIVK